MGFLAPFSKASAISLYRGQDIGLKKEVSLICYASLCVHIVTGNGGFWKMMKFSC